MSTQRVVRLFNDGTEEVEQEYLAASGLDLELCLRPCPNDTEDEVIERLQDADFALIGYEPITARVMEACPNIKMWAFRSIGFNMIDLDYANEHHIPVSHISQYCIQEVADYVMAAILDHNRRITDFALAARSECAWDYLRYPKMRRLAKLRVGLVGFGNIARLVAERLAPYKCEIVAYDPFVSDDEFARLGVTRVELEELFASCDYISSHLPLNPATQNMINAELLDKCTKAPCFINSSRGGVVCQKDLAEALRTGKLGYAILDVLDTETPDLENLDLRTMDNVLLTPHVAFYSVDSNNQSATDNLDNVFNFVRGDFDKVEFVNRKFLQL